MTRPRRLFGWRWWVRRAVAAILLGMVTTVGVAWGLAVVGAVNPVSKRWTVEHHTGGGLVALVPAGAMYLFENRGVGWTRRSWIFHHAAGEDYYHLNWGNTFLHYSPATDLDIDGAGYARFMAGGRIYTDWPYGADDLRGWPSLAMWADVPDTAPPAWTVRGGGLVLPSQTGPNGVPTPRALPLRILWRGFVIDTALFGSLWVVALVGPGTCVRIRRVAGGRCPSCAYDLSGIAPASGCPECGRGREPSAAREDRA